MDGKTRNTAARDLALLRNRKLTTEQKRAIASSGGFAYWSRLNQDERAREMARRRRKGQELGLERYSLEQRIAANLFMAFAACCDRREKPR
jgi:hypothetical protein